jgi:diacylglycerol O-acyltransferase / wax synthase
MASADRLTPLDTSFLHLEDAASHMHVAAVLVFEGPAPDYDDFVAYVERRLHLVPRYRQKLAEVPLAQARPRWVDDEGFDIRFHIRNTALPAPGGEHELRTLAARVFSQQLSRARPLWEMWLVHGLDGDRRFAVISKTHHAVVDGIAGVDLIAALFAPEEQAASEPWRPQRPPSKAELLQEALVERATVPGEIVRSVRSVLRGPGRIVQRAAGLGAMALRGLSPAPRSPYNAAHVGPDRRFAWVRASLADFKEIKNSLDGTVNDVVLTVVARALRRHSKRRGHDVDELRAFVPVSIRGDEQRGEAGNEVAGMIVRLPISCSDPVSCFQQISEETKGAKGSGQALGAKALTDLSGFAPPTLLDQGARLTARQRFVNLVVTNVPGPQQPLHMGESRLLEFFPLVPLGKNLALNFAILSYDGNVFFGLVGDFDAVPDLDDLVTDVTGAIVELGNAAGVAAEAKPARDLTPV